MKQMIVVDTSKFAFDVFSSKFYCVDAKSHELIHMCDSLAECHVFADLHMYTIIDFQDKKIIDNFIIHA